jgi:hypothetical protein
MPLPQTSKEKSARIDWGYVRRPSRLARVRGWLWLLATLLVAAPLAVVVVLAALTGGPPVPLAQAAMRGPVASPHAAWESNCEVCHTPFASIRPGHAADSKCEACHKPEPHHPNELPASVAGCADRHRDHQGRTASLTRLADENCVRCHASLKDHWLRPSVHGTKESVTAFASPGGHPEFRPVVPNKNVGRTLKFSHATHRTEGMRAKFTFEKIPDPAQRVRYVKLTGQADAKEQIRPLDCKACHELESGGRLYNRVTFDAHCRALPPADVRQFARAQTAPGPAPRPAGRTGPVSEAGLFPPIHGKRNDGRAEPGPRRRPARPAVDRGRSRQW